MFRKIVLCSDGSEHAIQAVRVTCEIAKRFDSEVTLVSVFNPAAALASFAMAPEAAPSMEVVETIGDSMHCAVLKQAGELLDKSKVTYRFERILGRPVESIIETARKMEADLIVLGSRGLSEWKALLIGSVSDGVLHHAQCPVLIVRGEELVFTKLLLACDGSAGAFLATQSAGSLARSFGAPLTVLNVVEPLGPLSNALHIGQESSLQRAREISATRVRGMLIGANCSYCFQQEVGHAAEAIVKRAEKCAYPLVVVGSRGLSTLKALALGSVSSRIAHHAPCSVLVVR